MSDYLLRSMLYVPAYKEKLIEKSLTASADAVIYDLEDSVPQTYKQDAREILKIQIAKGAFQKQTTFIRLNPLESGEILKDLEVVLHPDITGFLLPKVNTDTDMEEYDSLITKLEREKGMKEGHFKFIPLIESASAILEISDIMKVTKRTIAVCFGGEDFLNDIEGVHNQPPQAFNYPRAKIAVAARAAGVLPIDTPYLEIHDIEGFIEEEKLSYALGFAGIQVLSPRQIEAAHKCFTPDEEEVVRAKEIMEMCEKAVKEGSGVAMLNGKMIGPPMRKRAKKVLNIMEQIRNKEGIELF